MSLAIDEAAPIVTGVELGGTKAIAVIGRGSTIFESISIPTAGPAETLAALASQLDVWARRWQPQALGIASFGPIAIHPDRADYGHLLPTPKAQWAGVDIVRPLARLIDGPCLLHTDVTAAALAEGRWGAGKGLADFVYVTVGTGIGMGIVVNGNPVVGQMHPEAGHLAVRRISGDAFPGVCPFHGDCLEGLASGPAIRARSGVAGSDLSPADPAWTYVADALAEAFASLLLTLAPRAIIVGGGVGLGQLHLLPRIRAGVREKIRGYLPYVDQATLDRTLVSAALGDQAGPLGALRLGAISLAR
ncbi:ROK family protein [Sphingomonas crusticola]|uniref:ROK family protein n=1 Tax=Sphingomonas crusticola TaxID=1697973 RepID=UPI0019673183|nr:ROK family protein [Sphingomonas crusticola]